jgi:hypothetical protein
MNAPRMLYPVVGSLDWGLRVIATFFEYGDAVDFITAELGKRNLYLGSPSRDRRSSGYRFTAPDPDPSYEDWLLSLEVQNLGSGWNRVAA